MRVKYIDVLKAFAIIAVVLYHAGLMTYGYLGVDVFLVIAGYLTTRSLYAKYLSPDALTGGGRFYVDFEIRRVIRLLPPLLVAGVICMVLGFLLMLPDDYENLSQSVIATNGFGNNVLAAITTKNYWDISNDYKPLMHTWYVGLVMQFYLVYPLLFMLSRFDKRTPKSTLLTIVSALAVISLMVYFATTDTAQRFYYLPSRFFEFAVGGIVALLYKPNVDKPFQKEFVYICYVLLLAFMLVNSDVIPPIIRLVVVVSLSAVILCSQDVLENMVTGNKVLASIGAASYSIFIWHQILLAFYRYSITCHFTIGSYSLLFAVSSIISWLSYRFIEQGVTKALKSELSRVVLYVIVTVVFIALNAFAGFIFWRSGVVRDVPELFISKVNVHRGMHAEYVDRVYNYDHDFNSKTKPHWLVIGNSFGRDFVNVILESKIADSVEVSYIFFNNAELSDKQKARFKDADQVFLSSLGVNEEWVSRIEVVCQANGLSTNNLFIIGEKNFGESNGQFYVHRNSDSYFDLRTQIRNDFLIKNKRLKDLYGSRYLDLIELVIDNDNTVPVFTPDHHYISQDCEHFSLGGAKYYASLINWSQFLK